MDGRILAPVGAVVFAAIAVTATVIEMTRPEEPVRVLPAPALQPPSDPLRATLRRCQQLGEAAMNEADCLAAWATSRDRFLGRSEGRSDGRTPTPAAPQMNEGQ